MNFASSLAQTIPAINYLNIMNTGNGNRTLAGLGTIGIAGGLTTGSGTYTVTGSTVSFGNASGGTIPALSVSSGANYNNLTVTGGGTAPYVLGG